MKSFLKGILVVSSLLIFQHASADTTISNVSLTVTDKEWTGEKYILSGGVKFTANESGIVKNVSCPFQGLKISFDEIYSCENKNYKAGLNLIRGNPNGTAMTIIVYSAGLISWPYKDSVTITQPFDNEWHLKTNTTSANATPYKRH